MIFPYYLQTLLLFDTEIYECTILFIIESLYVFFMCNNTIIFCILIVPLKVDNDCIPPNGFASIL